MAEITAAMVKELREKTDAPMMECKKALAEAGGDLAKAEEILRVKLGSKAAKASSRVAAEGIVAVNVSADGKLLDSQQLEDVVAAKSVRTRQGRAAVVDGPFAETKEVLGGFNLIEADSLDEAVAIAAKFPWNAIGCVEVRPVRDMDAVRARVGA